MMDMDIISYIRSGNKIIILNGDRHSFRCRQRNNKKINSFKFVSFKEMQRDKYKYNKEIIGPLNFYTLSRL